MSPLQVFLLGAPRFERGGESIHIPRRKGIALLVYLTVTGQPQSRDAMATMFWQESDQSSARANLRRDLSRLKKSIGEDTLLVEGEHLSINPNVDLRLDVNEFKSRVAMSREHGHPPGQLCPACLSALTEAVAIYTGDFMAGFSLPDSPDFDEWQFFQTESLRQSLGESLQKLVRWHTSQGEYEEGIVFARRWLAMDALHEPAHRALMRLYAWSDQHAAALRQYQECLRLLEEELGVEPEEVTTALYKTIKSRQLPPPKAGAKEIASNHEDVALASKERYVQEGLLAVGGYGEVYRGMDRVTGQPVVIKRLKSELMTNELKVVERFVREGEALQQLNHPNIVKVLTTLKDEGQHSIVMEYVPGGSLYDLLQDEPDLPWERVLDLALEIADALARAHHLGIVHRDLKPENVLLAEDGTPRLTDFGMAHFEREDVRLTRPGSFFGSPAYMSPEALRGEEVDPRTDIWSFGVMLYELLTGRLPFEGERLTPVMVRILNDAVPDIQQLRADIPPVLSNLIMRMLVKDREDRIASMRQVAAELEAIRAGWLEEGVRDARSPSWTPSGTPASTTLGVSAIAPRSAEQRIQFCLAPDGVKIAYATVGEGPVLVKAPNWLSHLEYEWNSPVWRHWISALSRHHTLVRHDQRGCGLSDWEVDELSLDAYVSDLECVVAILGLERFPLLGISGGGPVAIAYAVRHPQKVSHLILYGAYATGRYGRTYSSQQIEMAGTMWQLMMKGWGQDNPAFRQFFTTLFMPEATAEQMHWFNDLQRISTSPEMAVRLSKTSSTFDVTGEATEVKVPTLILHGREDAVVPFDEGRHLAALMPAARFVPLESKNHILLEDEPAWERFVSEVVRFLGVDQRPSMMVSRSQTFHTPSPHSLVSPIEGEISADFEKINFVARQEELARLNAHLETALAGRNQAAFVIGEAGQGKTMLLQAFIRRAQREHPDLIAAGGNCNAYTGPGDPYLPFREILEQLTGDVEARAAPGALSRDYSERLQHLLPASAQILVEVGPDLLDTLIPAQRLLERATASASTRSSWLEVLRRRAEQEGEPFQVEVQQSALLEQYAKVIQAFARRAPMVLFLDDLQWIDSESANLLLHLGKRLSGYPVFLLGTYRPAEVALGRDGKRHPLEQVVNEMQRDFGEMIVDLSRVEGRAFVDALLDLEPNSLGSTFRETLHDQTSGHPLFTIELLRGMQERGDLLRDENGRWVEGRVLDWQTLPARVEGAIGERISRLPPELRELLQIASVEGEAFTAEVVAQVLGIEASSLIRRLSRELEKAHHLVWALGVKRVGNTRLSRYRFRHILIQRFLYHSLDEVERTYHHEAVGVALETLFGPQKLTIARQLARHFEGAGLPEKATVYLRHAGDQARRAAALEQAVRYYRAALEHCPESDLASRAQILRSLGECQWVLGHLEDALKTLETCFSLFETLEDTEGAGAVQRMIGRMLWEQGDRKRSLHHYHQALEILQKGPESVELARAISSISQMHMLAAEHDQAIAWGERALELAERLGADDVRTHALNNIGTAYCMLGDLERGLSLLDEGLSLAQSLNLPHDVGRAYYNKGILLMWLGRYEQARQTLVRTVEHAERFQVPLFAGSALVGLAKIDWLTGEWRSALSRRGNIEKWIGQGQSIIVLEIGSSGLYGLIYNDIGQPQEAYRVLENALQQVRNQAELQTMAPHFGEWARALTSLGMEVQASDAIQELLDFMDRYSYLHPDDSMPFLFICRWLADRVPSRSLEEVKAVLELLEGIDSLSSNPVTKAVVSEARGVVAIAEGDPHRAVEAYRRALSNWETLGRLYDQVRVANDLGKTLLEVGEADAAQDTYSRAWVWIETLASELDDDDMRSPFLSSALVQEVERAL